MEENENKELKKLYLRQEQLVEYFEKEFKKLTECLNLEQEMSFTTRVGEWCEYVRICLKDEDDLIYFIEVEEVDCVLHFSIEKGCGFTPYSKEAEIHKLLGFILTDTTVYHLLLFYCFSISIIKHEIQKLS